MRLTGHVGNANAVTPIRGDLEVAARPVAGASRLAAA